MGKPMCNKIKNKKMTKIKLKYVLCLLTGLFLLICCKEDASEEHDIIVFNKKNITNIDRIEYYNLDFIDSSVFVPLETSFQSILGEISQLEYFEGRFYINDNQTKKLKVFDESGKYLFDIGKQGRGPGEYVSIRTFFINSTDRKICIIDPSSSAIHEFSLEGVFLQTKRFGSFGIGSATKAKYANGRIFFNKPVDFTQNMAYFFVSAEDYSITEWLRPYPVKPDYDMYATLMDHPFSIFDNTFYYVSLFSDTIYMYDNDREIPYLYVETGKPNIPPSYLEANSIKNEPTAALVHVWRDDRYSEGFTEIAVTSRFILTSFKFDFLPFYLLDKKTNEGYLVNTGLAPNLGIPSFVENNRLIKVWTPDHIEAYMHQIESGAVTPTESVKSLLKSYDPEFHNPILIVYYLKGLDDE